MKRQKCTFKWEDKSVRLNGKTNVRLNARQMCTFKWKEKIVRLNGKAKVNVLMARQK